MMNLVFDHFFTFVDPSFKENSKSVDKFKSGYLRKHKGQGTSALFSFFEQFYLEWIWLSSLDDAKTGLIRADLRSDWKNTGWSPFGIGLRGQLSENQKKDFYCYKPPYAPNKNLWFHNESLENPSVPIIFVQEIANDYKFENWSSKNRKLAQTPEFEQWLYRDTGDIDIKLKAPKLTKLPIDISGVSASEGSSFSAKIKIKNFNPFNLGLSHFSF